MTQPASRRSWTVWIATGFGVGFSPVAPGTVGSLWGLPLAWLISQIPWLVGQVAVIATLVFVGVPLCTHAARRLGNKKDPGSIVWDEIATVPLVFFLVSPASMSRPSVLVSGFLLHRLFDILKLPPARQLEALPDGLGIMADDVAASVYACLGLHLLLSWFNG